MSPLNENKYNHHSKSKRWFFLKRNVFDTNPHPIRQSRKELKFRIKSLLSQQEEQMIKGLINTFQCEEREAIRIAFYEAARRGKEWVEGCVPFAVRDSTFKAHVGRSRHITVALSKTEKNNILDLANELDLSEKEVFRLAIIWMQRGIKTGQIRNIRKCKLISQDKLARQWSRENRGKPLNPKTAKIKDEIQAWQELFDMELASIDVALPLNCYAIDLFSGEFIEEGLKDELQDELLRNRKDIDTLNSKEKRLFGLMFMYEVCKEEAELIANDAWEEYNEYQNMGKRELVKYHEELQASEQHYKTLDEISIQKVEESIGKNPEDYIQPKTWTREEIVQGYREEDKQRIRDLVYEVWDLDKTKRIDKTNYLGNDCYD